MGTYRPISMKIGTQTKTGMLSSKSTKAEVTDRFQDGRRRLVGNSSACYKMSNYHPSLTKIGTQTKKNVMSSKVTKAEACCKKTAKIKCKKRYRVKKATLYEREVIRSKNFLFAGRSFHTHTIMWLDSRSLKFICELKLWCMRVSEASSVTEILIHV
jgi:hypothetical protein